MTAGEFFFCSGCIDTSMTEETLSTCVTLISAIAWSRRPPFLSGELSTRHTLWCSFICRAGQTEPSTCCHPITHWNTNVTQNVMLSHKVKAVRGNLAEVKEDCRQGSKTDLGPTLGWSVFPSSVQYGENEVTLLLNYNSLINKSKRIENVLVTTQNTL